MNRHQKEEVIGSLKDDFQNKQASFLVGVKGLSVTQLESLRGGLRDKGGKLKIAKARLAKLAVADVEGVKELHPSMKEQIGFVFADDQAPAVAKVLHSFAKENEALELVAGYFENSVLDKSNIIEIAMLPSREELLAMIARVLNEPIAKFARAVQAVADKKAEGGEAAPAEEEKAEEKPAEESVEKAAEDKPEEKAEEKAEEAKPEDK